MFNFLGFQEEEISTLHWCLQLMQMEILWDFSWMEFPSLKDVEPLISEQEKSLTSTSSTQCRRITLSTSIWLISRWWIDLSSTQPFTLRSSRGWMDSSPQEATRPLLKKWAHTTSRLVMTYLLNNMRECSQT